MPSSNKPSAEMIGKLGAEAEQRTGIAKYVAKREEEDVGTFAKLTLILEDHGEEEGADEEDHAHAQDAAVPSSMASSRPPPCSRS